MRWAIIIIGGSIVALIFAGYRIYNKEHRSVEDERSIKISADQLFNSFETDEIIANQKYLDKVLEVRGVISDVITNQSGESVLLLKTYNPLYGISCTMKNSAKNIQRGMPVTIKGICTGYLSDVVITEAILVEE
jgi:hypothetical protein